MIIKVVISPLKTKKYRAIMSDGSKIDFGLKGSSTYLDHKDKTKRIITGLVILEMIENTILLKTIFYRLQYYLIIYYGRGTR